MRSECPWENHKYNRWWIEQAEAAADAIEARLVAKHPAVMDIETVEDTIWAVTDFASFYSQDTTKGLFHVMWTRMYLEVITQLDMKACTHDQTHTKASEQRMRIGVLLIKEAYSALQCSAALQCNDRLKHMYNEAKSYAFNGMLANSIEEW